MVALPAEASTRVRMLSDKVKRRAYENAMAKAGALQKRSQAAVEKLIHTIDLVSTAIISSLQFSDKSIRHFKEYPTMQYFGMARQTRSIQ